MNPLFYYLVPAALLIAGYIWQSHRSSQKNQVKQDEARLTGRHEPVSLHPLIDQGRCIGCGSCVNACPEHSVIGLIGGKAELIEAANCIGHGACREACPVGAITLVFGTASRGVDIPHVSPTFESNVPGIFIAGELGGMGLIRNAVEQGRQAVANIASAPSRSKKRDEHDLLIVGAGPAGIAASLTAQDRKLNYVTIDQDSLGGTVSHFPRRKVVMTRPVQLPLVGQLHFRETSKETLIEFWESVAHEHKLNLRFGEKLETINSKDAGFEIVTSNGIYRSRKVLLCLGRRGTPRTLSVPGEELSKVVYRLIDAEQYRGQHVLVVGGGDSAVEAATSIAEVPQTVVSLAYRGAAFNRIKAANGAKLDRMVSMKALRLLLDSEVTRIEPDRVRLRQKGKELEIANEAVIVCAGGVAPNTLLERVGIRMETKYGTA
jgi:thioredoxin reductase (NADPH)